MKKIISVCLSVGILLGMISSVSAESVISDEPIDDTAAQTQTANGELAQNAKAAILMEASTGTILFEKNAEEELEPASITKIMTMALVLEQVEQGNLKYDDLVTASEHAKEMGGTQINLDVGEQMTVYDLMMSVAVASANDAAVALAEHIGNGSEAAFVEMMNQKAKELGMEHTHFMNPNGLPAEGHLTCAKDIALMSRYLLSFEDAQEFIATDRYPIRSGENEYMMRNSNELVRSYDGCVGVKTGYTSTAMHCLSAAATRDDMTIIAVVLGEPDSKTRFAEAAQLLDYGFENYEILKPEVSLESLEKIPVKMGVCEFVEAGDPTGDIPSLVVKKGETPQFEVQMETKDSVTAPVEKGQILAKAKILMDGEQIYEYQYLAVQEVQKRTFWEALKMIWKNFITM
jgi:D-alanyl-D-alanine carboxypeptidase (penicillin-binding protein 5/6)